MSVWKFKQDPKENQYREGIDLQEGQTTSSVPSSLRLLMKQMEEYAKVQRILELSGTGERLEIPYAIPPQEFICSIPTPDNWVTGNIVFVLSDGTGVPTEYLRRDYDGYYTIRFPAGTIIQATKGNNPRDGVIARGTICHFWSYVPAGWTDITDDYEACYIKGCNPDMGDLFLEDSFKRHSHPSIMSRDKREDKTVKWTFQKVMDSGEKIIVEAGDSDAEVALWKRGAHTHDVRVGSAGSFVSNCPPHITLRLGEKE